MTISESEIPSSSCVWPTASLIDANVGQSASGAFSVLGGAGARRIGRRRTGSALPRPAERDPLVLPFRFHVEMFRGAARRQGGTRLPAQEHRELSPDCRTAVSATIPAAAAVEAKPAQAVPAPPPAAAAPAAAPPAAPPAAPQRAVTSVPPPPAAPARPPAPKPQQTAKPVTAPNAPAPPPPAEPVVPLAKIEALPVPVRLAVIRSCRQDQDAVCSSVRAGGGRLIACLAANSRALSPPCKTALDKALR
jgi:hypothetical protein